MAYTIKEIGSGWDVRNLSYDQPIVKLVNVNYPANSRTIDSGWVLYDDDPEDSYISHYDGYCDLIISLDGNQPVSVSQKC